MLKESPRSSYLNGGEDSDRQEEPKLTYLGRIFHVTEEFEDIVDAILTQGSSLSDGERWLFESADFEIKSGVIMERHENISDEIPALLRAENILRRHPEITKEQAGLYQKYLLQTRWTGEQIVNQIDVWIKKRGMEPALRWLSFMAKEMLSLETPEHDPLSTIHSSEAEKTGIPSYGFHKVETIFEQKEPDWWERLPQRVRFFLQMPLHRRSLQELKQLGEECYKAEKAQKKTARQQFFLTLSSLQKTVFWDNYKIGKAKLLREIPLSPTTRAFLGKIEASDSLDRLKGVGRYLFKVNKGVVQIANPPPKEEWTVIFDAYHEAKARLEKSSPPLNTPNL